MLQEILQVLGGVIGYAIAAIIIISCTFVWRKYVKPFLEEKRLYSLVESLMASAEAIFKQQGAGMIKKDWVLEQLTERGIILNHDMEVFVENMIEGFMKKLGAEGIINTDNVDNLLGGAEKDYDPAIDPPVSSEDGPSIG